MSIFGTKRSRRSSGSPSAENRRRRRFQFSLGFLMGMTTYLAVSAGIVMMCRKVYAITLLRASMESGPLIFLPDSHFAVRNELLQMALQSERVKSIAAGRIATSEKAAGTVDSSHFSVSALRSRVRIEPIHRGMWLLKVTVPGSRQEAEDLATAVVEATLSPYERVGRHTYWRLAHGAADEERLLDELTQRCLDDPGLASRMFDDHETPSTVGEMKLALAARNNGEFMIPFGKERFTIDGGFRRVEPHYGAVALWLLLWTLAWIAGSILVRRRFSSRSSEFASLYR